NSHRSDLSQKDQYTRHGHFFEARRQYQGQQKKTIPDAVYEIIRREMDNYGLSPETVTKDAVYMILSDKRVAGYYEDINLIFSTVTGKPLPDVSHLEKDLLNEVKMIEWAYEQVKNESRKNSLNVFFKLLLLLRLHNVPCSR